MLADPKWLENLSSALETSVKYWEKNGCKEIDDSMAATRENLNQLQEVFKQGSMQPAGSDNSTSLINEINEMYNFLVETVLFCIPIRFRIAKAESEVSELLKGAPEELIPKVKEMKHHLEKAKEKLEGIGTLVADIKGKVSSFVKFLANSCVSILQFCDFFLMLC